MFSHTVAATAAAAAAAAAVAKAGALALAAAAGRPVRLEQCFSQPYSIGLDESEGTLAEFRLEASLFGWESKLKL